MKVKITRFEEIDGWILGRSLTREVYEASNTGRFASDFALRDHIRGAAASITHSIAERKTL